MGEVDEVNSWGWVVGKNWMSNQRLAGCLVARRTGRSHIGTCRRFHRWSGRHRFRYWFRSWCHRFHRSRLRRCFLLGLRFLLDYSLRLFLRAFLRFTSNRQMIAPPYCRGWNGNKACMNFPSAITQLHQSGISAKIGNGGVN